MPEYVRNHLTSSFYLEGFADSIGAPSSTVQVSTTKVFFNSVELRGNVWATPLY